MRLSEAIRLGSLAISNPHSGDTRVCAIGMALECIGQRSVIGRGCDSANYTAIATNWPWTQKRPTETGFQYVLKLAYMFDDKVCPLVDKPTMTIESLCDVVAGWERDLESNGINVEQVTMIATPGTTGVPDSEHTKELAVNSASR